MEAKPVSGGATIGEVARRAGLRPSALRYYERVGVLPEPGRENGRRRYNSEVMREVLYRLAAVGVAQQAGFTIAEIRTSWTVFLRTSHLRSAGECLPKASCQRSRR